MVLNSIYTDLKESQEREDQLHANRRQNKTQHAGHMTGGLEGPIL